MKTSLQVLQAELIDPILETFERSLDMLDDIFWASLIILLGVMVGTLLKMLVVKIGEKLKVSRVSEKIGFTHLLQKANIKSHPSLVIGKFLQGFVVTGALTKATDTLGFYQISEFLNAVIAYIPNVLVALIIVLFGIRIAETTSAIVSNTLTLARSHAATTLALTAKYIIVTFAIMAALFQLKIAADLVQILFTGFIAMIALAGGLAFGLGGKEVVKEFLEDLRDASSK